MLLIDMPQPLMMAAAGAVFAEVPIRAAFIISCHYAATALCCCHAADD